MPERTVPQAPCVLVVEDRSSVRHLVAVTLRQENMEVVTAATAEEAWEIMAERLPDIIVLDLLLPGAGGERLAKRLRVDTTARDIPVIIISGLEGGQATVAGMEAQDFLPKPFDVRDLVARVRYHLGQHHPDAAYQAWLAVQPPN